MRMLLKAARGVVGAAVMLGMGMFGGASVSQAQTTDEIVQKGKIVVGVQVEAVPYGFLDDKQQPAGFEIDLANLMAERMGVEAEIVAVPSASRIQYLVSNKVDVLIAFLGVTPERALQVAYTDPYFVSDSLVLASADLNIKSVEDLASLRVAVVRGTTSDRFLTKAMGESALLRFDDTHSMYQALISGQIDVVTDTIINAMQMMATSPAIKLEKKFSMFSQINGIAVRKDQFNLLQWLNTFIAHTKASGELGILYQKWLKAPMPQF